MRSSQRSPLTLTPPAIAAITSTSTRSQSMWLTPFQFVRSDGVLRARLVPERSQKKRQVRSTRGPFGLGKRKITPPGRPVKPLASPGDGQAKKVAHTRSSAPSGSPSLDERRRRRADHGDLAQVGPG